MKATKMYLSYLAKGENEKMTLALPFLRDGGNYGRKKLAELAKELYGEGVRMDHVSDNGHHPDCSWAKEYRGEKHFTTIILFEQKHLTEDAIIALGKCDEWDWRYFYAIMVCNEDRRLYAVSFSNKCSPNWNQEYSVQRFMELDNVDFPLLKGDGVIYRMDDALHTAINESLSYLHPQFVEQEGMVSMTVRDQHGNYTDIVGETVDDVFRDYADNYTGYRNYRRQMASEWEIVDDAARKRYENWKQTAKGLKSDFDKFYGGGIVD